ncbi:putative ABC-type xenobiotic transporter [Helianthus annuus]|nr:putative ABC-type xenobiotic transporter [Helianthus annuus]
MGFEPLSLILPSVENGVWATAVENEFGPYTPCATDSIVTGISHWFFLGLVYIGYGSQRRISKWKDGETGLAPYEIVTLVIKSLAWCCMLVMTGLETMVYVYEVRWFVRYKKESCKVNSRFYAYLFLARYVLYLFASEVAIQVLFGLCLLVYLPTLDPYPGYSPIRDESLDDAEYEELAGGEEICPERHTNIISSIFFSWMDPLMVLGYKRPLTEKDIWKLDTWDQTETLNNKEVRKPKPWLLRALHRSLGGRFWWGGFWKSMQERGPAQIGYIYAFLIFVGVVLVCCVRLNIFKNVMRVGFRLRSTLIAAVFRKSLRLTNESRRILRRE